jgi:hypothetical protein
MDSEAMLSSTLETLKSSSILLVSFANLMPDNSLPPFCYVESLRRYPANKLFLRDLLKFMYLQGIDETCGSVKKLSRFLRKMMRRHGSKKSIFIGNSSGGYAALLYGILTRPDEVLAFAPRSYLDPINREKYDDRRNPHIVDEVARESSKYKADRYLDLRKVYLENRKSRTTFHLFWDTNHRIDDINARRMDFAGFVHHPYPAGGHLIAKYLRDEGIFDEIIKKSLSCR